MSFLKDVKVSKVSFVKRAANKRKFLLLKSDEEESVDNINVNINQNKESYKPMRKEVREFLVQMLKSADNAGKSVTDLVAIVKADDTLKLSDEETQEVTDFVEFSKDSAVETKQEPVKKEDKKSEENTVTILKTDYEGMKSTMESLQTKMQEMSDTTQRREIISFLEKECPYNPSGVEETADLIMSLMKHDPKGAEKYKEDLKKASAALEHATIFNESGSSADDILKSEGEELDLVRKFSAKMDEIKKAEDGRVTAASVENIIRGFGRKAFDGYRVQHILRAKQRAI